MSLRFAERLAGKPTSNNPKTFRYKNKTRFYSIDIHFFRDVVCSLKPHSDAIRAYGSHTGRRDSTLRHRAANSPRDDRGLMMPYDDT